jgi:hypothetical protein
VNRLLTQSDQELTQRSTVHRFIEMGIELPEVMAIDPGHLQ